MTRRMMRVSLLFAIAAAIAMPAPAQDFGDAAAITQFQRAADGYAFAHRQTDRRGARPEVLQEGAIFTPVVAAAFRTRIAAALQRDGCAIAAEPANLVVPRVNAASGGAALVPACITAVLPRLPDELEYRVSGVVLVLSDAHRHIVVDVVHGAFPLR